MESEEENRRVRGGGGSVRGIWMSVRGRFVREIVSGGGTALGWWGGVSGIVGATGSTRPRRGGMVGTRGCWGRLGALRRGFQWVAKRTLGVDRIAPGRGGGVRKLVNQTWIARRRGRGGWSISHSARAILALCGIAPHSRRTSVRMTFTCGGQVARAGRVR